eukprot:2447-Heterococcus_DN1.PRE.1
MPRSRFCDPPKSDDAGSAASLQLLSSTEDSSKMTLLYTQQQINKSITCNVYNPKQSDPDFEGSVQQCCTAHHCIMLALFA